MINRSQITNNAEMEIRQAADWASSTQTLSTKSTERSATASVIHYHFISIRSHHTYPWLLVEESSLLSLKDDALLDRSKLTSTFISTFYFLLLPQRKGVEIEDADAESELCSCCMWVQLVVQPQFKLLGSVLSFFSSFATCT